MTVENTDWLVARLHRSLVCTGEERMVATPHGRLLVVGEAPFTLAVYDYHEDYFGMGAQLKDDGYLRFSLYTRKPIGFNKYERHPDMHAAKFATHAVQWFESTGAMEGIEDIWEGKQDEYGNFPTNYAAWRAHMPPKIADADEATWLQAINSTWSAQLWAKFGYDPYLTGCMHFAADPPEHPFDTVQVVYKMNKTR